MFQVGDIVAHRSKPQIQYRIKELHGTTRYGGEEAEIYIATTTQLDGSAPVEHDLYHWVVIEKKLKRKRNLPEWW